MKKKIFVAVAAIALAIGCAAGLSGCGVAYEMDSNLSLTRVWVDEETNVEYLVVGAGDNRMMAPRFHSDGTIWLHGDVEKHL